MFRKLSLIAVLLCYASLASAQNKEVKQPNIILFIVDDMGWQDTSEPFWTQATAANKKFRTPNLEKLSAVGVKFTNAYANSICTPSRVSMMTGMNTAHHKVTNWTMFKDQKTDALDDSLLAAPAWNINGLSAVSYPHTVHASPLPQLLKDAGYYTIMCGKAHFGAHETPGANPLNLGFVKNIGGSAAGNPSSFYGEKNYGNTPGTFNVRGVPGLEKYWGTHTNLTEALTLEALTAMDTAAIHKKPFFLLMSHYAVHLPFDSDDRFIKNYQNKGITPPEAAYATLVEGMDKSLGDIRNYLQKKNLAENTILIFISDNGGYTRAPRQGPPDSQNAPLKNGKGSLYEGGIRVPMVVYNPFITKKSAVATQYISIPDLFPTILKMAGVNNYKTIQEIDGKDFSAFVQNPQKTDNDKTILWHFPNKWTRSSLQEPDVDFSWMSAARKGDWKIIYYHKTGETRLFNLKNDISEKNDLSKTHVRKNRQMKRILKLELNKANAQMPVNKTTGKAVNFNEALR